MKADISKLVPKEFREPSSTMKKFLNLGADMLTDEERAKKAARINAAREVQCQTLRDRIDGKTPEPKYVETKPKEKIVEKKPVKGKPQIARQIEDAVPEVLPSDRDVVDVVDLEEIVAAKGKPKPKAKEATPALRDAKGRAKALTPAPKGKLKGKAAVPAPKSKPKGKESKSARSALTDAQVSEIKTQKLSRHEYAAKFKVSYGIIRAIQGKLK